MKKLFFVSSLLIFFVSILGGCVPSAPSEADIQTAIARTAEAKPIETDTPKPTATTKRIKLPTPEVTNTPRSTNTPEPTSTIESVPTVPALYNDWRTYRMLNTFNAEIIYPQTGGWAPSSEQLNSVIIANDDLSTQFIDFQGVASEEAREEFDLDQYLSSLEDQSEQERLIKQLAVIFYDEVRFDPDGTGIDIIYIDPDSEDQGFLVIVEGKTAPNVESEDVDLVPFYATVIPSGDTLLFAIATHKTFNPRTYEPWVPIDEAIDILKANAQVVGKGLSLEK